MSLTDTNLIQEENRRKPQYTDQSTGKAPPAPPYIADQYYTRDEVNIAVTNVVNDYQMHRVINIYSYLCQDQAVVHEIIIASFKYDIPLNLLFALISTESNFRTDLIVENYNGSFDYGIMQCNSGTFTDYNRDQLLDLSTNIRLGCEYLVKMKKRYSSWEMAVYRYNGIGTRAVKHLVKVLNNEREIDSVVNRYL